MRVRQQKARSRQLRKLQERPCSCERCQAEAGARPTTGAGNIAARIVQLATYEVRCNTVHKKGERCAVHERIREVAEKICRVRLEYLVLPEAVIDQARERSRQFSAKELTRIEDSFEVDTGDLTFTNFMLNVGTLGGDPWAYSFDELVEIVVTGVAQTRFIVTHSPARASDHSPARAPDRAFDKLCDLILMLYVAMVLTHIRFCYMVAGSTVAYAKVPSFMVTSQLNTWCTFTMENVTCFLHPESELCVRLNAQVATLRSRAIDLVVMGADLVLRPPEDLPCRIQSRVEFRKAMDFTFEIEPSSKKKNKNKNGNSNNNNPFTNLTLPPANLFTSFF